MELRKPERRAVVLVWRDVKGREHRETRFVSFVRGFGSFVTWHQRRILVAPLDQTLYV